MQSILRAGLSALLSSERHKAWQWVFAGCAAFWILLIVAVMGIR